MRAIVTRGRVNFFGDATPASDHVVFQRDEILVTAACAMEPDTSSTDPFVALSLGHGVATHVVKPREEEPTIKPIASTATGGRYRGPRGALLAFKNTR